MTRHTVGRLSGTHMSMLMQDESGELTAGHIQEGAVDGGDPQVGGASVKQHSEVLRRGADADHPVVLGLRGQNHECKLP